MAERMKGKLTTSNVLDKGNLETIFLIGKTGLNLDCLVQGSEKFNLGLIGRNIYITGIP